MGSICISLRLAAHFGHWRQVCRRGRNVRRWQVEAGLTYGQVKKCYRRRKLVRVMHVMRLGTEDALKVTLQKLGFSGRLNTAFIERVNLTVRNARRSPRTPHLGDGAAVFTPVSLSRVVARLLSLCTSPCLAASEARAVTRARRQTPGATLPTPDEGSGSRQNQPTMDGSGGALVPLAAGFCLSARQT